MVKNPRTLHQASIRTRQGRRIPLGLAVGLALTPPLVWAQQSAQSADSDDAYGALDTIVVTGSAIGGVKKLEASYNIVTADEEQIRRANPKSTADLLKISPGLWPETTGGQTGANIEIAGFPGGGDAPYYTTLLMGSPLYGMPSMSFFETTSIFRLDDTVRSVEILQGGPSVVFAGGQMGATANFLLKTGSDVPTGSFGLTYGDQNLWRVDSFVGFPINENWFGSIGGFYRVSDGVRDPEFKADEGGQITATLKRVFDRGELILYGRYLDDKNQFITPIPLIQHGTDHFTGYPGFDPLTGTYYSNAIRRVRLDGYPGGGTNADLADGRGAKMWFVGANFDYDFDNGWRIENKFIANAGDVDTNALFSGSNPALLYDKLYTIPAELDGLELPVGSATARFKDGSIVPDDQDVISQGWWYIHKELENINNDFRLSKEIFDGNTLTVGVYLAYYTMDDKWALGNQMLMTNEPNARPITLTYVQGGQTFQRTDEQGFLDNGGFNIAQRGHAFNSAIYLSDTWRIGQWLLDASVRYENQDATNRICNLTNVDLDSNPLTIYNNETPVCDGTVTVAKYDEDFVSWTVGANYSFTRLDVLVRAHQPRRSLLRLRQRHSQQSERSAADASDPQLRGRLQVRERSHLCGRERILPRFHRSALSANDFDRRADRPDARVWLGVGGREFHRCAHAGPELPLPGRRELARRRVHGLRCLLPVLERRHRRRLRADRRQAAAAPTEDSLHADAELSAAVHARPGRGIRHVHVRGRSHAGSIRAAAARHVSHLGLRHHRALRRELGVLRARHECHERARAHGKQLAHLRPGSGRRRRPARASARRP